MKPRLLLGDDHVLILEALRAILERDYEVVGTALDGRELLNEAVRLHPDAVLLDINMPVLNGIEAARQIRQRVPEAKLLFLTQAADSAYVGAAFAAGASAYVLKQSAGSQLGNAIHEVLQGKTYVSPQLESSAPQSLNPKPVDDALSPKEQQFLNLMASGKAASEIAGLMKVSLRTVEFVERRLMEKLSVSTRTQLTAYAHATNHSEP